MNVFYRDTVTVFNREISEDVMGNDVWHPTVLHNVHLLMSQGITSTETGQKTADGSRLSIMTDTLEKQYAEPSEWKKDTKGTFTLQPELDFFVPGDASGEDTSADNFLEHMKEKYECRMINAVSFYKLIPHIEVSGK